MESQIPEVVIDRLPLYARALALLEKENIEIVSSQELGAMVQMTPAQIRKDLSYFGRFGKQGRGYNVQTLRGELLQILGLDRQWSMALVGVGRLGRALISYGGFVPQGFRIVAAFDTDPRQIGRKVGELVVQDVSKLSSTIKERGINIVIVAVPPPHVQKVTDELVGYGVKAILNYAPAAARVPSGVKVREIDPVLALQSMTFYLK